MTRAVTLCILAQAVAIFFLISSHQTTFAYDRPYHSAFAFALITGILLLLISRYVPALVAPPILENGAYSTFSLDDFPKPHSSRIKTRRASVVHLRSGRIKQGLLQFLVASLICLRVEFTRQILSQIQCTGPSYATILPCLLIMFSKWRDAKPVSEADNTTSTLKVQHPALNFLLQSIRGRSGLIVAAASLTYWQFSEIKPGHERSTYICAEALTFHSLIPLLQISCTFLDFTIVSITGFIVVRGRVVQDVDTRSAMRIIAVTLLITAAIIVLFVAPISYRAFPQWRYWMAHPDMTYNFDALKLTFLAAVATFSTIQLAFLQGFATSISTLFLTWIYCSIIITLLLYRALGPPVFPIPSSLAVASLSGLFLHMWSNSKDNSMVEMFGGPKVFKRNRVVLISVFLLLTIKIVCWYSSESIIVLHPIRSLMAGAKLDWEVWSRQAMSSASLTEAAEAYRKRYGRSPPPRFDKWYNYATLHESRVIDDFDNIYHDLRPFWSLTPHDIRLRTWEAFANPWNDIGGIVIRNGKAVVASNVPGSHRWMLDGVVHMIDKFAKWLPDMDLAFNLNDECRVAIGYEDMPEMPDAVVPTSTVKKPNEFSKLRHEGWKNIPEEPFTGTRFEERSWHPTWNEFGIAGCPPSSRARRERHWDLSTRCASCSAPHTHASFMANWTMSADPCHQPDLGDLHGLHLSPAAFKASKRLEPVFSQSKAHGYNDIRHPSAWNYEDKAVYAPNNEHPDVAFLDKEPTFFWRGATTEGVSPGTGVWRGMVRQRLVHLFNNASDYQQQLVLLPTHPLSSHLTTPTSSSQTYQHGFSFRHISPLAFRSQITTSVGFVSRIERCDGRDCSDQHVEFQPQTVDPIDFQQHWRYRYLFDLDGAGFSGRFLPFLKSNSLVLKAGLMREWWEGRILPWQHFVPLDIRLSEAWSIAAFFAGWKAGNLPKGGEAGDDRSWLMEPHDEDGEAIASQGQEWANQVLRKEDMEIYMFRLLLEFGRLTDDARDTIGYTDDLR